MSGPKACSPAPCARRRRRARGPRASGAARKSSRSGASSTGAERRSRRRSPRCAPNSKRPKPKPRRSPRRTTQAKRWCARTARQPPCGGAPMPRRRATQARERGNERFIQIRGQTRKREVGAAALHGRPDAQVPGRHPQPEESLRRPSSRPLRDRGHRSAAESAPREGPSDHRHTDAREEAARPHPQDRRRPVRRGPHAGRARSAPAPPEPVTDRPPAMDTATLEYEIAALRETEDICLAIRQGEVDAVVVGRSDEQKRVLLLSGAYTRYRELVEDMAQGAVTITSSGDILFSNYSFAAMVGESPVDLFRTVLERWVAAEDRHHVETLRAGRIGQRDVALTLKRKDGGTLPVRVSLVSASDDFVTLLITDLSGQKEQFREAEETLEAIRKGAVDAFVVDGKQILVLEAANTPYRAMVERMRQGAVTVSDGGESVYASERSMS